MRTITIVPLYGKANGEVTKLLISLLEAGSTPTKEARVVRQFEVDPDYLHNYSQAMTIWIKAGEYR